MEVDRQDKGWRLCPKPWEQGQDGIWNLSPFAKPFSTVRSLQKFRNLDYGFWVCPVLPATATWTCRQVDTIHVACPQDIYCLADGSMQDRFLMFAFLESRLNLCAPLTFFWDRWPWCDSQAVLAMQPSFCKNTLETDWKSVGKCMLMGCARGGGSSLKCILHPWHMRIPRNERDRTDVDWYDRYTICIYIHSVSMCQPC